MATQRFAMEHYGGGGASGGGKGGGGARHHGGSGGGAGGGGRGQAEGLRRQAQVRGDDQQGNHISVFLYMKF